MAKILIVPDKFKGTLTAPQVAEALARGWRRARPADKLEQIPMSDGGDGFGELVSRQIGAKPQTIWALDAAHHFVKTLYWWHPKTKLAIIESARIIGLAMLPPGKFHPFELDTLGVGLAMRAAAEKKAQTCIVGIGGSATNDAGFGLARCMGWKFFDRAGKEIEEWTELNHLAKIKPPARRRRFKRLIVAVDVQNRLLGSKGCSRVYGPQKGLKPEDFPVADAAMRALTRVLKRDLGLDFANQPGAGAAGGLGFGLMTFLGAKMAPGFALFARYAQLEPRLKQADLVLTGEGAIDDSTLMGKGVGELALLCRKHRVPCLGLGGSVADPQRAQKLFAQTYGLTQMTSLAEAKAQPAVWLERAAELAAKAWRET